MPQSLQETILKTHLRLKHWETCHFWEPHVHFESSIRWPWAWYIVDRGSIVRLRGSVSAKSNELDEKPSQAISHHYDDTSEMRKVKKIDGKYDVQQSSTWLPILESLQTPTKWAIPVSSKSIVMAGKALGFSTPHFFHYKTVSLDLSNQIIYPPGPLVLAGNGKPKKSKTSKTTSELSTLAWFHRRGSYHQHTTIPRLHRERTLGHRSFRP